MNQKAAIEKLVQVIRLRHLALSTEQSYSFWLARYCKYISKLQAPASSERKMEMFLSMLANDDVSASTQNQAFNALLFFYQECLGQKLQGINSLRAKRGAFVRRAPAVEEVRRLLAEVKDEGNYPVRLVVKLLYGCGMRVTEPLSLRLRDINLPESRFIIPQAKGGKDRVVAIPCSLVPEIQAQMKFAEMIWQRDVAARVPIQLPGLLRKKYPNAQFAKSWAWLFPQLSPCHDPRDRRLVRWHQLESTVQRAMKNACRRLGLDIKPHELRHGYATHSLNMGQNPRAIQEAMGHKSLETTMGYCHAEALSVRSPLEVISKL
jgi:integron integrase